MGPSAEHEARREVLGAIAVLSGFDLAVRSALPDGSRPDVLYISSADRRVFIGEAKHSETPGCLGTLARMRRYLAWFGSVGGGPDECVLAVCHSRYDDRSAWQAGLRLLAFEEQLDVASTGSKSLGLGATLTWAAMSARPARVIKPR
jgi:hypothetical protein